jgi:N-hydroxyarylamine O-acetyltransferase
MNLAAYLARIGLAAKPTVDLSTLALIMAAHSRSIAFENFDVVVGKHISIMRPDVEAKLVQAGRGGYCWEQNTLLQMALEEIGFDVMPLMCRVRWGKPDDSEEPNTTFTHSALKVTLDSGTYLADVGFAGTNSIAPVLLGSPAPQQLPEGQFRVVDSKHKPFSVLELLVKGEWRPLYEWRNERAPVIDMECSNWFSCTYPSARFTSQFFASRVVGDERIHILNDEYVVRKGHGVDSEVAKTIIADKAQLLSLIENKFGIQLRGDETEGLDRYLTKKH